MEAVVGVGNHADKPLSWMVAGHQWGQRQGRRELVCVVADQQWRQWWVMVSHADKIMVMDGCWSPMDGDSGTAEQKCCAVSDQQCRQWWVLVSHRDETLS